VVVDAEGNRLNPSQSPIVAGAYLLTWSGPRTTGTVLAIVAGLTDTGWRVGTATAVL
jgi:hypothetical protein